MPAGLSILMPVYNERATVEAAIADALSAELPVERELVVVDDGSTDGTTELLRDQNWPAEVKRRLPRAQPRKGSRRSHRARARER